MALENPQSKVNSTVIQSDLRKISGGRPSVIVVGSGFAGLAAARSLADASIQVVVLESRDRIGGRAYTDYSFGFPVDLGAAWLHGVSGQNPLASLISRLQLPLYRTSNDNSVLYDHDLESYSLFTGEGKKVPQDTVERVERVFEDMLQQTRKLCEEIGHDISMKDALEKVLERCPELRLEGVEQEVLQWYVCRMEGWFATDLDNLSAQHWEEEVLVEGGHGLMVGGYFPVLRVLAQGLDIRLGTRVTSVDYSAGRGVRVGTAGGLSLLADAVVVTAPIGVLQAGSIEFRPSLPPAKQHAMANIGAGIENKVALLFDTVFWPGVEFLGVVAPTSYACGYFLNLHRATGAPVLVFMPAGQLARDMESMTDEAAVALTMDQLRKIIPDAPHPAKFLVTQWGRDPSSLCSYSYDRVGVSTSVYDDLRTPVEGRVFFAGEATCRSFPGTVHGAYLSGLQAAQGCWKMLGQEEGRGCTWQESVLEVAPASSVLTASKDGIPLLISRL